MARKKAKRRRLTPQEEKRAHGLIEAYNWLAEDVASQCWHKYRLWQGFSLDDLCSVAIVGLCEAAVAYVRLGYDLPDQEEKLYLARSIINAVLKYVDKERRARNAEVESKSKDGTKKTETYPVASLGNVHESRHPFVTMEYSETPPPPLDIFRIFAKTLPAQERSVFETAIQYIQDKRPLDNAEIAESCGLSERHLSRIRHAIDEKLMVWLADEWGLAA